MRRDRKVLKMAAWLLVLAMLMTSVPMPSTAFAKKAPKLNCKKATIKVGKTKKLRVKNAGSRKVKWSSSKKKVAAVNSKGLVKGKSAGRAVIKAKVGKKVLKCGIIVKAVPEEPEETDDVDWDAWENQTVPPSRTAAPVPTAKAPSGQSNTMTPEGTKAPEQGKTAEPQKTASGEEPDNTPEASPEETTEPALCTVQVTTYKDGNVWSDSGKIYYLKRQGEEVFETGMQVADGVYDIYVSNGKGTEPQDTGEDVEVTGHNRKIAIQYYTVSFMDENCLMQNIPQQVIRKGEKVKCPDIIPGKIGYEFVGWEIDEEDGNDPVIYDFDRKVTKTTVLQVKWKAASERTVYAAKCYYENLDGSYPDTPSQYYENISAVADSVVNASDYTPEGFTPDPDYNQSVSVKADGNTVAVYYYKRLSYTLTWDYKGGSDGQAGSFTETVKYGQILTAPVNVIMTGYVCVGWVDEDGSPLVAEGTMPAKNTTYKAVWKKESEVKPTPATEVPPVTEAPATKAPATELPATDVPATEAPATELPATNTPETDTPQTPSPVTETPATEAPETEVPVTQPPVTAVPVPTPVPTPVRYAVNIVTRKDGAVWSDASKSYYLKKQGAELYEDSFRVTDGVYEIYVEEDQNVIDTGISVTVNGRDSQVYVDYYTVSFMDGTSLMQNIDRQIVLSGKRAVKPSITPGKVGYAFAGWMLDDTDTEYDFDLAVTAATVIKAKWEVSSQSTVYKIEYYLEDLDGNYPATASGTSEDISAMSGTLVKASDFVLEGFTPDTSKNSDVSVTADGNTVARFYYKRLSYSLTWYYNGGTRYGATSASESVKYGAALTAPSDVIYNGYQCAGWLDAQGQQFVSGSTMPAADLSYTAKWQTVEYSISYSGTEGAGAAAALPICYNIESETFTIASLTRTGYTFLGWTGSNGSSPQQTVTIWKGSTGNLSYTANWKADPTATPTVTPTATPTMTPTATPTATPTVTPTATPTMKPTATPTMTPTTTPTATPTATPTVTPTATPTVKPTATPTVKPTASTAPSGNKYVSSETLPASAATNTLTVGKFSVTLGMSEAEVRDVFGHDPEITGDALHGCTSYVYNPSGDFKNLVEVQFKAGKVVEMSTISKYFCYEGIAKSSQKSLSGFGKMSSKYGYNKAYTKTTNTAYVNVFIDNQGSDGAYGIQIYDKTLDSMDNLLLYTNLKNAYTDSIASTMQKEMSMYAAAFRMFKTGLTLNCELNDTSAQEFCEEVKEKGVTAYSAEQLKNQMKETYDYVVGSPVVLDGCADAFGFVVGMIDDTNCANAYKYLTSGEYLDVKFEGDDEETTVHVDFYINCGFSYNPQQKNVSFAVIYIYAEKQ